MRILLTGRNGQVGWELEKSLAVAGEISATDREALDLGNPDAIRRTVRDIKPGVIVNAAAYTAVDRAQSEPEIAMRINGVAPGILAEEAKRLGALLVHYSTDYVFDGEKATPYVEDDPPGPLNVYGRTKLEGEKAIAASGCRHLILRTSWVYGPRGNNFFLTIARKALAGGQLRVVSDQRGVPAESSFIAETTGRLLQRAEEGVFHLVPSGATTWHGFAEAIVEALGLRIPVEAVTSDQYPTRAPRPRNSALDCAKLAGRLNEAPPSWRALLDRCAHAWNRR